MVEVKGASSPICPIESESISLFIEPGMNAVAMRGLLSRIAKALVYTLTFYNITAIQSLYTTLEPTTLTFHNITVIKSLFIL